MNSTLFAQELDQTLNDYGDQSAFLPPDLSDSGDDDVIIMMERDGTGTVMVDDLAGFVSPQGYLAIKTETPDKPFSRAEEKAQVR